MKVDALALASIRAATAELALSRAHIQLAAEALQSARQAEADAVAAYNAAHEAAGLDPKKVTALTKDQNGPNGRVEAGTVFTINTPNEKGEMVGGGQLWEPPAVPAVEDKKINPKKTNGTVTSIIDR